MRSKKVISELHRIKTLMGINETESDILNIENIDDIDNCTYYENQNPPEGVDYWFQEKYKKMTLDEKVRFQKIINDYVKKTFNEVKGYFYTTYRNGKGYNKLINKFVKGDDKDTKVKNLLDYINNATYKLYYEVSEIPVTLQSYSSAWAFTQLDNVYINIFNFWDGTLAGKKSMYDTLLHELSHVMQNYMLNNPNNFNPPFPTFHISSTTKKADKEKHSNLQSVRKLFNIGVADTPSEFIEKIKNSVLNKTFYWDLGEIKISNNKLCFLEKIYKEYVNNIVTSKENFLEKFMYTLRFNLNDGDEHIADISYLLSDYYKIATAKELGLEVTNPNLKVVYIDLIELSNLNQLFVQNNNNSIENLS